MDRFGANSKSNIKNQPPASASGSRGFDSLYASFFGSGDRQNYSPNPGSTPSANESLYPSSPYHHQQQQQQHRHQMPSSSQMPRRSLDQTQNGLPYQSHPSDKWHPSRSSPSSPQHQEEPYSIGPFDSIWSMKSSEMAGPSAGVQGKQRTRDWCSDGSRAGGYRDSHAPMPASNGLPFGGYGQHPYAQNDVGFHGNGDGCATTGYSWSTNDGVSEGNVPGLADWHWNQGDYSSMQSGNWQSNGLGADNHEINEWELNEDERERRSRQERREWKRKGLHQGEFVHMQKSASSGHAKPALDKVVASFLEKYRDKDPSPLTPENSVGSDEHILLGAGDEEGMSHIPSAVIEELGPVCQKSVNNQHIGQPLVDNLDASVSVQETSAGDHIPRKSPSPEPEKSEPNQEHQETTSNVDSSDLADRLEGREARSLSDPVTVQEVQQNASIKSGTSSRKSLGNGKIRPGKRKPKLPRDKRRSLSLAEKSDVKSCGKQTGRNETKDQPDIASEPNVQSSKPTTPPQSKLDKKENSVSAVNSCLDATPKDLVSDVGCFESSICSECTCTLSSDPRDNRPSLTVKENIGVNKPETSNSVSSEKSCEKLGGVSSSKETFVKSNTSSVMSAKNGTSNLSADNAASAEKVISSGHKSKGKKHADSAKILQQKALATPLGTHKKSNRDNSDCSSNVRGAGSTKSQNTQNNDIVQDVEQNPVPTDFPNCKPNGNSSNKNIKHGDETKAKADNGSKLSSGETGSLNQSPTDSTSKLIQEKKTNDKDLFFDPKRIFGGTTSAKAPAKKQSKEAEKSLNSSPVDRIPKSNQSTDAFNHEAKEKVQALAAERLQHSAPPDPPVIQQQTKRKASGESCAKEGMANGTIPCKDLPPQPAQTVPSTSAKDALASKVPILKAEPEISQHQTESTSKLASPSEPRPSRLYSYKMDSKTGVLRRSSDPKVEEVSRQQAQRRDSGGTLSSSDEVKGERRCSGDSHMDGFHHPFGCSAECYKRSSSPSTSRSGSSSQPASSVTDNTVGFSASSSKKEPPKRPHEKTPHVFPHPEDGSGDRAFDASAFAELREGLKKPWLSKEERKEDQRQEQERIQREHLRKVQQQEKLEHKRQQEQQEQRRKEKEDKRRRQEKQDQRKPQETQEQKKQQQEKRPASASHAKRPTRATYSTSRSAEQESSGRRSGTSRDQPGSGTNTQQPRRHWPTEDRPRVPAQDDSTEDSDTEEDLTRGITDEWWFHFGKKLCNGVLWFFLFSVLLCLVLLSFVLAFARDTCKFAYRRGWDIWNWYTEKPPPDDDFFSSHRSNWSPPRSNQQGGSWFFGFGRNQQREPGTPGSGAGSWNHTGSNGPSSSSSSSWQGNGPKQPRKKQTHNIELPITEQAAISRILRCDPGNYYEVVGVAEDAAEDEIKKFYRKQCMLVHPDKTDEPRANEAFQILQKAYAILSDTAKRSDYDLELNYKEHLEDKVNDLFKKMAEMSNSMPCGMCRKSHKRYETDLPIHAARYCATHDTRHPVRDGALWKETANLGFKIYVFLCDDRTVYDVTEWAACQNLDWLEANSCRLMCKVKRSGRGHQHRHQHSGYEERYEEMFDDIFGSGAFRQFQASSYQQGHHGNSHHGNGGSHSHAQQGGGSRNKGVKKSRKKKK